jgi:hypothetical protein
MSFIGFAFVAPLFQNRHCEERSDEAIHPPSFRDGA